MILSHTRLPIPPIPHIAPAYIYEKRYAKTSVNIDLRKGLDTLTAITRSYNVNKRPWVYKDFPFLSEGEEGVQIL